MGWNLVAPNTWKNDRSDYVIEYDPDYSQYVIRSMDGTHTIPFDDIFNNPVFPVDFSNITVLGKHFRAEGVNTPNTPGFSFQGDANTGIYRISEDLIGISTGGNKVSEINSLGLLNGTPGTDFRNLIKRTTGQLTRIASPTTNATTNSTSHVSSGVGFSYTPVHPNSKIVLTFICSVAYAYNNINAGNQAGYVKLYVDTSLVPNLNSVIPGTSTPLHNNENMMGYASYPSSFYYINSSLMHNKIDYQNTNLNTKYFYVAFRSSSIDNIFTLRVSTADSNSFYIVEEFL